MQGDRTNPRPRAQTQARENDSARATGDGQVAEEVIAARDKMYGIKVEKIREKRAKEFGFAVPQIPFPTDVKTVGRQWTKSGDDKPTKLKD